MIQKTRTTRLQKISIGAIIFILWVLIVSMNSAFLKIDTLYPVFDIGALADPAYSLGQSSSLHNWWQQLNLITHVSDKDQTGTIEENPPLIILLISFLVSFVITHIDSIILIVQSGFLLVLMCATYGIARKIGTPLSAVIAVLICISYAPMLNFSRTLWLVIPLTALGYTALFFLFETDFFRKRKNSFLWAFFFSMMLLAKCTFVFFFFLPTLVYAIVALCKTPRRRKTCTHMFLSGLVVLTIAGWWYILYAISILHIRMNLSLDLVGPEIFSWDNLRSLIWNYNCRPMNMALFVLFLVGLYIFIKHKASFLKTVLFCVPILYMLFGLALFPVNSPLFHTRNFLPLLPWMAIITSYPLTLIKKAKLRQIYALLLISTSLISLAIQNKWLTSLFSAPSSTILSKKEINDLVIQGKNTPCITSVDYHALTAEIIEQSSDVEKIRILMLGRFFDINAFFLWPDTESKKRVSTITYNYRRGPLCALKVQGAFDPAHYILCHKDIFQPNYLASIPENDFYLRQQIIPLQRYMRTHKDQFIYITSVTDIRGTELALYKKRRKDKPHEVGK